MVDDSTNAEAAPETAVAPGLATRAEATEAAKAAAAPSYEEVLASISLGPKARREQLVKEGRLPRERSRRDPHRVVGVFKAEYDGARSWPPKASEVRLKLRADGEYELEARCWKKGSEDEELERMLYEEEWFAPLEYGDADAAQTRVRGRLLGDGSQGGFCRMSVTSVEEVRNGARRPPLTEDDFRRMCGPSLLNALEANWRGDLHLSVKLDRRGSADWVVGFRRDANATDACDDYDGD